LERSQLRSEASATQKGARDGLGGGGVMRKSQLLRGIMGSRENIGGGGCLKKKKDSLTQ